MRVNFTRAIVALLFAITLNSNTASAQFKDKFFFSNGFSIYTDLVFGKKIVSPVLTSYYPDEASTSGFGASIFTYTPNFRYNLTEFDANSSLSLNIPIGLGLMASEYGFGSIEIPLYVAYNTGNISTYSADKNKGFTVGLGIEYFNMAVFKNSDYTDANLDELLDGSSWVSPCVNIGFRYWNRKNVAREFNLKVGFGPSTSVEAVDELGVVHKFDEGSATSIKLTWFRYLNY